MSLKRNSPGCGCCDECPTCNLYQDGCLVVWECEEVDGAQYLLTSIKDSNTTDYGDVGASGSKVAQLGATYTLRVVLGDDCEREYVLFAEEEECECPTGCFDAVTPNAKPTATITTFDFGSATHTSGGPTNGPVGPAFNCFVDITMDLSSLNHSASFPLLIKPYTYFGSGGPPITCYFQYIEPFADYYIGSFRVTQVWTDHIGSTYTATADWDAYGSAVTGFGPDSITLTVIGWRIKLVRTASNPYVGPNGFNHCPFSPAYANGDTSAASITSYSEHISYDNIRAGAHTIWCDWNSTTPLDPDYLDERISRVALSVFNNIFAYPAAWHGKTQWDSLFL